MATCSFERPVPVRGGDNILYYTAPFAPAVLEYFEASGDRATAEDLWPLVLKKLDFTLLQPVSEQGLFASSSGWWLFIDWHPTAFSRCGGFHAGDYFGNERRLFRFAEFFRQLVRRSQAAKNDRMLRRLLVECGMPINE